MKFNVGDVVRLKKELNGDLVSLTKRELRSKVCGLVIVEEVSRTGNIRVNNNYYVHPDNLELVAVKPSINEAYAKIKIEEKKPTIHKWTLEEIRKADLIAKQIMMELYDEGYSPVFYATPSEVELTLKFGHPSSHKDVRAKACKDDEPNVKIGKCVALCKLTGHKIPKFILEHNDENPKDALLKKFKAEGYNWITRDEDGAMCVFQNKPRVLDDFWARNQKYTIIYDDEKYFKDVTWKNGAVFIK